MSSRASRRENKKNIKSNYGWRVNTKVCFYWKMCLSLCSCGFIHVPFTSQLLINIYKHNNIDIVRSIFSSLTSFSSSLCLNPTMNMYQCVNNRLWDWYLNVLPFRFLSRSIWFSGGMNLSKDREHLVILSSHWKVKARRRGPSSRFHLIWQLSILLVITFSPQITAEKTQNILYCHFHKRTDSDLHPPDV